MNTESLTKRTFGKALVFPLLMILLCLVSGTVAYLTYMTYTNNTFTIGHNEIEIDEDFDPPSEIVPGTPTIFKKNVQVSNTGTVDCYIRVFCEFSTSVMKQYSYVDIDGTEDWVSADEFFSGTGVGNNWTFVSVDDDDLLGGWFYYTEAISPGETTESLMQQIKVLVPEENQSDLQDFEIIVYAESMQVKDNDGVDYSGYYEAWTDFLGGN